MSYEKTSEDPLIDGHSNDFSKGKNSMLFLFKLFSLINSLEEEGGERLKRVLIHVINNTELDEHEIKHGTFSCNSSIDLSQEVNFLLSLKSNILLDLDLSGSLFGDFERLNKSKVL
jgi:hypothetical protein